MTRAKIRNAVNLANEFMKRAKELDAVAQNFIDSSPIYFSPKESGALRRISMDLTRALAEMRKP